MAAKIYRINYKSDFILTLESDAGWMTPFCIKFWTGAPSQAYFIGWDGETYTHCTYDPSEPTKLQVQFDDHYLPIGDLKFQVAYHFTVADFPDNTEDEVINPANITTEIDGETYQVMLDFTGETAPEIEFSLPAYANEAQRIANEEQRIAHEAIRIVNEESRIAAETIRQQNEAQRIAQETARVNEFATLKSQSQAATSAANTAATLANDKAQLAADKAALAQAAATLANEKAQLAADKAALANAAAQLANEKAALAQQKAEYAQQQGGYAKNQGDYAKNKGDYAKEQGDYAKEQGDYAKRKGDDAAAQMQQQAQAFSEAQAARQTAYEQAEGTESGSVAGDGSRWGTFKTNEAARDAKVDAKVADITNLQEAVAEGAVYDVSAKNPTAGPNNDGKWGSLSALLSDANLNTLIPSAVRRGGMSIKFVLTSDNNYVQFRYMLPYENTTVGNNAFKNVNNWQGVDKELVDGSKNLTESGVIKKYADNIKKNIDSYPLVSGKCYLYDSGTNKVDLIDLSGLNCAILSTKVGDIWHIKTKGTGTAYPYYVVDSEYNVLQTNSYAPAFFNDKVEVTSENAAYIIVNCIDAQLSNYAFYNELSVAQNKQYITELKEAVSQITGHVNGGLYNLCLFEQNAYIATKENGGIKLKYIGSSQDKFVFYTPDMRFFKLQATNDEISFDLSSNTLIYVKESEIGHNDFANAATVSVYSNNWAPFNNTVDYIPLAISYNGNAQFNFLLGSLLKDTYYQSIKDSFIYQSSRVDMNTTVSGNDVTVVFSDNPTIFTQDGKHFKLFPSNAESFELTLNSDRLYYVDDDIIPINTTSANPYYLSSSDIKSVQINNNVAVNALNDKVVLAVTTNSRSATHSNLYNYGAIGRMYYDQLSGNLPAIIKSFSGVSLDYNRDKVYLFDASLNKVYLSDLNNLSYKIMPVNPGEIWRVKAKGTGIAYPYYVVDDELNVLKTSSTNVFVDVAVEIPNGATKIIANCQAAYYDSFELYNLASINGNTEEIAYIKEVVAPLPTGVRAYFPQEPKYGELLVEKCPNFYQKMKLKNSDVTVVLTGTSLTQGNLYASTRDDATTRPPLLHTKDLASAVFDKLINNWFGQKYRRYDHSDLQYTNGDWLITNDLVVNDTHIWDDEGSDRNGLTKTTTDANAGVSITVPNDAWQFNFIYRSDSQCGLCTVSIQEGNSKMEVFDGTNWVEANGYQFSMLEPAATATKGNTCYQKRLKMRCKNKASGGINSIGTEKNITISKGNDSSRFNVVGFEWSPREYMFTLINGARGSHQWGSTGDLNLEKYQDNDIWIFNPDLILAEVTVINWGGSSAVGLTRDPLHFVNLAKRAYFNEFSDNPDSIYETSEHWTKCEVLFYGDTVSGATAYNECWDINGNPKFGTVTTPADNGDSVSTVNVGKVKTVFENYDAVDNYMFTKNYIYIPVTRVFKSVAEKYYGTYRPGFAGSGKDGATLSIDGTHLNDNGAALWASLICPVFDIF